MGSSDVRNVRVEEKSPSSHYPNTGSPGLVAPTVPSVESIALLLHNLWIWSVAGLGLAIKRYRHRSTKREGERDYGHCLPGELYGNLEYFDI